MIHAEMLSTPILHSILKHFITTIHLQTTTHNDIYLEDLSSRPNVARRTTAAALLSTSTERDMGGTTFTDLGAREGNNWLGNRPGSTGSALWQLACGVWSFRTEQTGREGQAHYSAPRYHICFVLLCFVVQETYPNDNYARHHVASCIHGSHR